MVDKNSDSLDNFKREILFELTGGVHYPFSFADILKSCTDDELLNIVKENLDGYDNQVKTLLTAAIENGRVNLCKRLLALGCDPDHDVLLDASELCIQAKNEYRIEMLDTVLKYSRIPIYDQHASGSTLLHQAVAYGQLDVAKYLLKKGASLEDMDTDCNSVRQIALDNNRGEMLKELEFYERQTRE